MNLAHEAFEKLYPDQPFPYTANIMYSSQFKGYNARVQLNKITRALTFRLSKNWQTIDNDIQIGLLQSLMTRIFRTPATTINTTLYETFLKSVPNTIPRTKTNPLLESSFTRVNTIYFDGIMAMPNFDIKNAINTLGTYDYATDTISITHWLFEHPHLLDYVMYHELLHKKHKFSSHHGRHCSHTPSFRAEERKFENWQACEKQLNQLVRTHAVKKRAKLWLSWL